ncbi:hypothetical protein BDY17DRAFT_289397 [Neohortaea acidophila]|uniref:Secreted protein n=1 Tax=Neohortaea acidophila TaxID=245834 RepID=A0A6A6Q8G5_9PEZI|nr:uncharacterized protein BDY17DRAFT_289397 [Neohortaea acidophila]KAF2487667.1 hypothetical protein BDY17DRAFT_289397 [Neohortaea acidophila]
MVRCSPLWILATHVPLVAAINGNGLDVLEDVVHFVPTGGRLFDEKHVEGLVAVHHPLDIDCAAQCDLIVDGAEEDFGAGSGCRRNKGGESGELHVG